MLFRQKTARQKRLFVGIRRGGDIRPGEVVRFQYVRDNAARDGIAVRVAAHARRAPERLVTLVVARPENERGVVAVFFNDGGGLLGHRGGESFVLRRQFARHGEILPNHDAVRVAVVEKVLVLVKTAAPAAHNVAAEVAQHRQDVRQAAGRPGGEGVEGHPVGAHGEDFFAVDTQGELAASLFVGRPRALEGDGAHPHGETARIDRLASVKQFEHGVIEGGFARVTGVPEAAAVHLRLQPAGDEPKAAFRGERTVRARTADPYRITVQTASRNGGVEGENQPRRTLLKIRLHRIGEKFLNTVGQFIVNKGVAPYSAADDARHDVPAEHRRRFAQIQRFEVVPVRVAAGRYGETPRLDGGGLDVDDDFVAALPQPDGGRLVGNEHVRAGQNRFAVEIGLGRRVDALETQRRQAPAGPVIEAAAVKHVETFKPLQVQRVGIVKGVGDDARALQVEFKIARHLRRDALHARRLELGDIYGVSAAELVVVGVKQPPFPVENIPVVEFHTSHPSIFRA
ncbi:MAG: hypothetical protein BWY37_02190 [Firmicutes bacterium ADurb.Bin262]|nr:MAG: hypothetical protein BWY37_02190 [Firmicutes bacterium ADurb.Bin262]